MNDTPPPKLLDRIQGPEDLKALSLDQLPQLAQELRDEIIQHIAVIGGHLASSLGVVELTVALHYVFDSPRDKIIWDVGHQSYSHKLLTGRRQAFATLRQMGGISGFPRRVESPHDVFGTGHASTSLSAAMGIAEALARAGDPHKALAVIGDGGLTGGMALEALNQTRPTLGNLIVVLNDNEMSIAPSVGAFSTALSEAIARQSHSWINRVMRRLVKPLPQRIQDELAYAGRRWRQSFLGFFTPGILIEAFGYHYIGPVDGHRLDQLIPALTQAKAINDPILVHVLTKKGKGYAPAEADSASFHGIGPFDIETGYPNGKKGSPPSYTQVFSQTLLRLFAAHPKLVAVTAAMPQGTGLDRVQQEYPDRVFDMGITEPHCVTFAAGMATQGYRPVVAIYSTFLQRAFDQILHDVCLQNLPVIFCLDRAGLVGEDGPTHHGLFDLSFLRALPNLVLMAPADENELQHMLRTALEHDGPVAIRYPRGAGPGATLEPELKALPLGKAEILELGEDLVLFAVGTCVAPARAAARLLKPQGVSATVVNARFVKPLDRGLILELVQRIGRVVTIEENVLAGGFGSGVLETLEAAGLNAVHLRRIGLPDRFIEHGSLEMLRNYYGLDPAGIARTCLEFLSSRELIPAPAPVRLIPRPVR
jgi:1-deoxy-D-xylulose-5-phosphate synthase